VAGRRSSLIDLLSPASLDPILGEVTCRPFRLVLVQLRPMAGLDRRAKAWNIEAVSDMPNDELATLQVRGGKGRLLISSEGGRPVHDYLELLEALNSSDGSLSHAISAHEPSARMLAA
jgi:hypothetical protein